MQPLKLSPLPCAIPTEDTPSVVRGECDFVDEGVVRALMAGPVFSPHIETESLAVAVKGSALDFAGWSLPAHAAEAVAPSIVRRPGPPVLSEAGPGASHRGPHHWWLAGMAGAACSFLFAGLLLQFTTHGSRENEPYITIRPTTVTPAAMKQDGTSRRAAPQLTRLHDGAPMTRD